MIWYQSGLKLRQRKGKWEGTVGELCEVVLMKYLVISLIVEIVYLVLVAAPLQKCSDFW